MLGLRLEFASGAGPDVAYELATEFAAVAVGERAGRRLMRRPCAARCAGSRSYWTSSGPWPGLSGRRARGGSATNSARRLDDAHRCRPTSSECRWFV
jgi:hypothetical protein